MLWQALLARVCQWDAGRFGRSHLALSIACIWGDLYQEDFVKEYIKAHNKICHLSEILIQADQGHVFHALIRNLKPGLAKFICNKDCKTIEDTYWEACNAEQNVKFATCPYNGKKGQSSSKLLGQQ